MYPCVCCIRLDKTRVVIAYNLYVTNIGSVLYQNESMYVRSAVVSFCQFVLRSIRSTDACACAVPYMN